MALITVIGRGHSGTRAISHTLSESGVFMGDSLNGSGDLIPAEELYEACSVMAKYVEYKGGLEWDFSKLHKMKIDPYFIKLIESYLASVLKSKAEHKGWKLPETTLIYPWIIRLFPEIKYILWFRDPRDSILGSHLTDDMERFAIPHPKTDNIYEQRAISWFYQWKIIKSTPVPKSTITLRFEDFILKQEESLKRLEKFLGFNLEKIPVRTESVGRWKKTEENLSFDFLKEAMSELEY